MAQCFPIGWGKFPFHLHFWGGKFYRSSTRVLSRVRQEKCKELAGLGGLRRGFRVTLCSISSHIFHSMLRAALLSPCRSHPLQLSHTWENPTQQRTTQSISQRVQSSVSLLCPEEDCRPAGRAQEAWCPPPRNGPSSGPG